MDDDDVDVDYYALSNSSFYFGSQIQWAQIRKLNDRASFAFILPLLGLASTFNLR